ncbi:hypothetical protein [Proteiniclasticum sp.]|uniref:hypothetical protein n=1 Tax=Proteiniclasticum sp. TaxID=2053595 RepID=UPI00289FEB64|nr:hypothetical protein [Proteiniclasticum sp.]
MKLTLYPRTKSVVFSISFMIMAVILVVIVAYLGRDIEVSEETGFFDHMNLAVMTIAAFAFSIVSLITGALAVLRDDEKSILCYGALVLSAVAVYFGVSEFIGEMNLLNTQTK